MSAASVCAGQAVRQAMPQASPFNNNQAAKSQAARSAPAAPAQPVLAQPMSADAGQLFALANQARLQYGLAPLQWDQALAAGAMQHCLRMAQQGTISHRYSGEADVTGRAARAGAHFSLIEENVAMGPYASGIHQGWMKSRDHRENLLNPAIDRMGIAVAPRNGTLYAVADYERSAATMTAAQVEANFAALLHARGLSIVRDPSLARAYCSATGHMRATEAPDFTITWQDADLSKLPAELSRRVASRAYTQAAVGSCGTQQGGFTSYRVAVLLYGTRDPAMASR